MSSNVFSYPLLDPITALLIKLLFIPHKRFVSWSTFFGLIEISFPSLIFKLKISKEEKKPTLQLELKYYSGNPVISNFERVSKPGRRIFSSADSLPKINNGLGIAIISTPKGVMTDIDARKQKVGGEIICKVF